MAGYKGNHKINMSALEKQIKAIQTAINQKMKEGDLRGVNSLQKKLTKTKRELKRYNYI